MSQPRIEIILPKGDIETCFTFLISEASLRLTVDNPVHNFPGNGPALFCVQGPANVTIKAGIVQQLPSREIKCYTAREARERAKKAATEAVAREQIRWATRFREKAPTVLAKAIAEHMIKEVLG